MPHTRLFTVEEANALIPKLELLMERVQRGGLELREAVASAAAAVGVEPGDLPLSELFARQPEIQPLVEELERLVGEIDDCGGQFKGLDLGLVDFPAEIDGKIGLLCWQFGEKEIGYWHELERGFGSRKPLPSAARRSYLQ